MSLPKIAKHTHRHTQHTLADTNLTVLFSPLFTELKGEGGLNAVFLRRTQGFYSNPYSGVNAASLFVLVNIIS